MARRRPAPGPGLAFGVGLGLGIIGGAALLGAALASSSREAPRAFAAGPLGMFAGLTTPAPRPPPPPTAAELEERARLVRVWRYRVEAGEVLAMDAPPAILDDLLRAMRRDQPLPAAAALGAFPFDWPL